MNNNIKQNICFYLLPILLLMVLREVDLFINPRFWAEEGKFYFYHAFHNGIEVIWFSHQGYFSIIPNISAYIATIPPLKYAPFITTIIALFIQLIPHLLIYYSKSQYFSTIYRKLFASIIILFVGHTAEIWLNTITSQFHFIVIAFLILIDERQYKNISINIIFYVLLIFSGLSGVPANMLAPFFIVKYFYTKNKTELYYFFTLMITSIIQIIHIIFFNERDRLSLLQNIDSESIINIILSTFQYPVFHNNTIGLQTMVISIILILIFFNIKNKRYFYLFFLSSIFISILMVATSLEIKGGERYSYAPSVIFILGLMIVTFDKTLNKYIRVLAFLLVVISVSISMYKFPIKEGVYNSSKWSKWLHEVNEYNNGDKTVLSIYPQWKNSHWFVDLSNDKNVGKEIEYKKLSNNYKLKADLHPWNKNTVIMGKHGISIHFKKKIKVSKCMLSLDSNDKYIIKYKLNDKFIKGKMLKNKKTNVHKGLINYNVNSKVSVFLNEIQILPVSGDGNYSLGHLVVY